MAMQIIGHFERHIARHPHYFGNWWIGRSADHELAFETASQIDGFRKFTMRECGEDAVAEEVVRCLQSKYDLTRLPGDTGQGPCVYLVAQPIVVRR